MEPLSFSVIWRFLIEQIPAEEKSGRNRIKNDVVCSYKDRGSEPHTMQRNASVFLTKASPISEHRRQSRSVTRGSGCDSGGGQG